LRGYDGHLIMAGIEKANDKKRISCIPNNMEKYMTFSIGRLQFIASLQFLNASLDELVKNLNKNDFKIFSGWCKPDKQELLLRKGVFPYEYITSITKTVRQTSTSKISILQPH